MLPFDDEEEARYAAWLMANAEIHICNKDELVQHLELRTRLNEFLAQDNAR